MNEERLNMYSKIILATNQAILGLVNPSLRDISFDWDEASRELILYFYNDGPLTKNLEEHYQLIAKNIIQDFFLAEESIKFDFHILRLDCPALCPYHLRCLYGRREPFQNPVEENR